MNPIATPFANSIPLTTVLPLLFYLVTLAYVIFTAILYYHWQTYSANPRTSYITYVAFFSLSLPLIILLAGAAIL